MDIDAPIRLQPLTGDRLAAWRSTTEDRLAWLLTASGLSPEPEAHNSAAAILRDRLDDPEQRKHSDVLVATDTTGRELAECWLVNQPSADRSPAVIFDLVYRPGLDPADRTALIERIEEHARERGATSLGIDVFCQDRPTAELIKERGFRPSSIQMILDAIPERDDHRQIVLRQMTDSEFSDFVAASTASFAEDLQQDLGMSANEAWQESERQMSPLRTEGLAGADGLLFTATVQDEPVGVLWLERRDRSTGPYVFVLDLLVHERHRRRGYGRTIMIRAEQEARRLGATAIGLHVFGHNHAAIRLYEDLGYRRAKVFMIKDLDSPTAS